MRKYLYLVVHAYHKATYPGQILVDVKDYGKYYTYKLLDERTGKTTNFASVIRLGEITDDMVPEEIKKVVMKGLERIKKNIGRISKESGWSEEDIRKAVNKTLSEMEGS